MKRFLGHAIAAAVIAGGGAVISTSSACTHNDQTIFVRAVLAPPSATGAGQCVYQADPGRPVISSGVADAALAPAYTAVYLIGSQLVSRTDPANVRAESNRVTIKGAVVKVLDFQGNEVRPAFTRTAAGFIDPATGTAPSYGSVAVEIVDRATLVQVGAGLALGQTRRLLTKVTIFGTTLGGVDVESNEFEFPVDVCRGCLVAFPADSVDKARAALEGKTNCLGSGGGSGSSSTLTQPCVVGNDQYVDCRLCQGIPECDPASRGLTTVPPLDAGGGG